MPSGNERSTEFSTAADDGVRRVSPFHRPGPLTRLLASVLFSAIVGFVLLVLIPFVIVGAVALGALRIFRAAHGLFGSARGPNAVLDARRNVRVIRRDDPS